MSKPKPYGLLIPNKGQSIKFNRPVNTVASVFNNDTDSDDDCPRKTSIKGPGVNQKRQARFLQAKALEEDPTIFQYDELYDEMDNKRQEVKKAKTEEVKQPKYIKRLLETADKRKKEQERRIERQVQKEREAEGEMFKDKESFVTSAYRKKLEEMKEAEAEEKREEYLESIGDVTKQRDLGGFYRFLYEQQLGAEEKLSDKEDTEETETTIKFTEKSKKERIYRKRKSSVDEKDDDEVRKVETNKKAHLQSNLDADSDFSIDSSDSSEPEEDDQTEKIPQIIPPLIALNEIKIETTAIVEEETSLKSTTDSNIKEPDTIKTETKDSVKDEENIPPPKPKIDIWKKRTVGDNLDEALERYYQRKSLRESG